MRDEVLDYLKTRLTDWSLSVGGSYWFEKEIIFRPNWLSGDHARKVRIQYNDRFTKIEFFINGEFWEKFFEAGIYSIDDMETVFRLFELDELLNSVQD